MSVDQWQMSRVEYAGCRIDKSEKNEVVSDWGYHVYNRQHDRGRTKAGVTADSELFVVAGSVGKR